MPRFSSHSLRIAPTYSGGVWIVAAMIGSSMRSMSPSDGNLAGLSSSMTSRRSCSTQRKRTVGAVVIEIQVVLALQPLLDDLHVQQAEEAAAKAEAQRRRGLGLARERGVVEPQLVERVAQILVARRVGREDAGEHHRLGGLEAGQRLRARARGLGDGVADARVGDLLDRGGEEAHLARPQLGRSPAGTARTRPASAPRIRARAAMKQIFCLGRSTPSIDAHQDDHAAVAVVPAVEQQDAAAAPSGSPTGGGTLATTASRISWMPFPSLAEARMASEASMPITSSIWRRTFSGSAAGRSILLMTGTIVEVVVQRQVDVGQRLRLDPLRGVDHQQRALAGRQRPRHLVVEVDVAGRVDEVQLVGLAVVGLVRQPHRRGLDGDPALALEVHAVEELRLALAIGERAGGVEQAVGQRRLAVIDVGDDGEVADECVVGVGMARWETARGAERSSDRGGRRE